MTRVTITKNANNSVRELEVSGHAEHAGTGQDIVCAAISALTVNTINSIDLFTQDKIEITVQDTERGLIACCMTGVNGEDVGADTTLLMKSYELGVTELAKRYPEISLSIRQI